MGFMDAPTIASSLEENRRFEPPAAFSKAAWVKSRAEYDALYLRSVQDPEAFWSEQARERLHWFTPFDRVLEWNPPFAKWFLGGRLNAAYNCLDRHLATKKNKAALIWEGDDGSSRTLTYQQLHREVSKFANVLKAHGLKKGDVACIYLPMVPELAIAMLACARIGVVHNLVFGGFSAHALKDRIQDSDANIVVTADGGLRGGKVVPLKPNVDEALTDCPSVKNVVVVSRAKNVVLMQEGRDVWWDDVMQAADGHCPAEPMDSEAPLFILYTSGTTGKPKGILHTTAGYLLYAGLTFQYVFDNHEDDTHFCTADIGWITGHSYVVYGPLSVGATSVMFEGTPFYPDASRFWQIVEKYAVSTFYTAPTAIRALAKAGPEWTKKHDLSSLRLLGSVGEPINPEAWMWYYEHVGQKRCPVVDTWWQTETGGIMITPLPGAIAQKPGSATLPFFGILPKVLRDDGSEASVNEGGYLVIEKPWPAMSRGIWNDAERFQQTYFSKFKGVYFTGDGARKDVDGYFWLMGRVDDVINIAGHRLGTAEIESALVSHPSVAEAAVVPRPHDIKGQSIYAFVTLKTGRPKSAALKEELIAHVAKEISPIAKPDVIHFADDLPKTRSGKIMRRILKAIAADEPDVGDVTTLADPSVVQVLQQSREA